jgi:hypothetical protein
LKIDIKTGLQRGLSFQLSSCKGNIKMAFIILPFQGEG